MMLVVCVCVYIYIYIYIQGVTGGTDQTYIQSLTVWEIMASEV